MAAKSANLYARIEPDVKEQAEEILATLGIPASNAINMFYKQIILNRGLPFEVKIPTARPVDISRMNAETLDMELEMELMPVVEAWRGVSEVFYLLADGILLVLPDGTEHRVSAGDVLVVHREEHGEVPVLVMENRLPQLARVVRAIVYHD